MLEASKLGAKLWRRNIGQGWIGESHVVQKREVVALEPGDVVIKRARPFHNGVAGQSDMWGWRTVTITPAMVGQRIAQHVEIEDKGDGDKERPEQASWGRAVLAAGGVYGVARDVEDVRRLLG